MKTIFRFIALIAIMAFANSYSALAQLKYNADRQLIVNANTRQNYNFCLGGSAYLEASNGRFLQINVLPANPRLAGTGNQVVFYNSETSTFNSIQVANVYTYSDARAKTNIANFNNGLEIISKLRPVKYNFINSGMLTLRGSDNAPEYGLLAQELETILPGAVITDEEGNKLVNYQTLIPILIEAVQSLQKEIDELKNNSL